MNTNLLEYYAQRAAHYEDVYQRAERQADLNELAMHLQSWLAGKNVLEVACGTGYWTERYAPISSSVLATDGGAAMLQLAQAKPELQKLGVKFQLADALHLPQGQFDACVAGFWWSHMKRSDQSAFLEGVQKACATGALLVMFDNCNVEGDSVPTARTDLEGNTWQIRRLPDGSRHEVIKNYPTDSALRKKMAGYARDIRIVRNQYFWMLTCVLR